MTAYAMSGAWLDDGEIDIESAILRELVDLVRPELCRSDLVRLDEWLPLRP